MEETDARRLDLRLAVAAVSLLVVLAVRLTELGEEQERELVSDPKLLLVGVLAINHWSIENMLQTYQFSETELLRLLTRLDRLKIIELMPGNRIKVRLARHFAWRKGGPIQRFFEDRVQKEFFRSSFLGEGELRIFVHGSISKQANELIQQRLKKIAEEFDALVDEDRHMARGLREGNTLLMAIRPLELETFSALRKPVGDGAQLTGSVAEKSRTRRRSPNSR